MGAASHAVRIGGWGSVMLPKYSARNWPGEHTVPPEMVNVWALEVWPSGLRTVTCTEPAFPMSLAGMAAVSRVALTNVVVRALLFQRTLAPETKPVPSTVSVKAGPPAVAVLGVSVVMVGAGIPPVQLTWATASPPRS